MTKQLALAWESCPAAWTRGVAGGERSTAVISAERRVERSAEVIHAFLADLSNHRHLTDHYLRLRDVAPDGRGARLVVGAPLGVRRTARTAVTTLRVPTRFGGTAAVGRRTLARVDWTIEPEGDGSRVALRAVVLRAGPLDRLLLAAGGRRWLRRRFRRVLARLDAALVAVPPPIG
jgi:polyketide cyclase/dehydrase/lipid transport protein